MISVLLNWLMCIMQVRMWSGLKNVLCELKRHMYSAAVGQSL